MKGGFAIYGRRIQNNIRSALNQMMYVIMSELLWQFAFCCRKI